MRSADVTYCAAYTRATDKCRTRGFARVFKRPVCAVPFAHSATYFVLSRRLIWATFQACTYMNVSRYPGRYSTSSIVRSVLGTRFCDGPWLVVDVCFLVANSVVDFACHTFLCPSHVPLYLLPSSSLHFFRAYVCKSEQAGDIVWCRRLRWMNCSETECDCWSFLRSVYIIRVLGSQDAPILWVLKLVFRICHKAIFRLNNNLSAPCSTKRQEYTEMSKLQQNTYCK